MSSRLPSRRRGATSPSDPASEAPAGTTANRVLALAVLLVVAASAAALLCARPPAPSPADAPPAEFSAARAMATVSQVAATPRPLGSPASDRARDQLVGSLRGLGLQTGVTRSTGGFAEAGHAAVGAVDNIVATRRGSAPTGAVVLVAHYDSVAAGPGAADDGAAVASILETVRAMNTGPAPRNDLVVLLTDGEEQGLLGAQAFARDDPLRGRPAVFLNWEARGAGGPSMLFQTSPGNARLLDAYRAVPHPAGDSSLAAAYALLPNNTDFTPLLAAGRPGLNSAFTQDAGRYHTPGDSPANLDPRSVQQQGSSMLALAGVLGAAELGPLDPVASGLPAAGDVTYNALFGQLWSYSDAHVLPLAILAVLALLGAVVAARGRGLLTLPRLAAGIASFPVPLLLAGLFGEGAWRLLVLLRGGYANGSGFPLRPDLMQVGVLLLGVLATLVWGLLLRRRLGAWALGLGSTCWLATLGVLAALTVPGASFLFALPALGIGLGAALAALVPQRWRPLPVAVGALPLAVLLVPFAVTLFDGFGLAGAAGPAAAVVLAIAPLAVLVAGRRLPLRVPTAVLVAAVALGGLGLWVDRPDPAHPDSADLAYLLDAGTGTARWVSRDQTPAPWTARYATGEPSPPTRDGPWPGDDPVRTGPAPAVDAPAPAAVGRRLPDGAIELRVGSRRGADTIGLRSPESSVRSVEVTYVGQRTVVLPVDGNLDLNLYAVPAGGARIVLRTGGPVGPLPLVVRDQTIGLAGISGWTPRPPGLDRSSRPDGDAVIIARSLTA